MLVGLRVTGTNFLLPQETIHYPRQEVDTLDSFRGHIELVGSDADPSMPRCVGCGLCMELCPSRCIRLTAQDPPAQTGVCYPSQAGSEMLMPTPKFKAPPPGREPVVRPLLSYILIYHTCSLCGLCVQNCPAGSIRFSGNVYLSGLARENFEIDLMARLKAQSACACDAKEAS